MHKFLQLLKSGGFLSMIGVLLLCALVWIGGPWIGIAGRQP